MQSLTLTEALFTVIHSSALILLRKSKNDALWSHTKKRAIYGPGLRFVSVLHENGTVSDRYENNSCRVSDRHDRTGLSSFLGRSVPCKRMKRNVRRAIRTLVCYTAVFSVVTQRSSPLTCGEKRCVTTLM